MQRVAGARPRRREIRKTNRKRSGCEVKHSGGCDVGSVRRAPRTSRVSVADGADLCPRPSRHQNRSRSQARNGNGPLRASSRGSRAAHPGRLRTLSYRTFGSSVPPPASPGRPRCPPDAASPVIILVDCDCTLGHSEPAALDRASNPIARPARLHRSTLSGRPRPPRSHPQGCSPAPAPASHRPHHIDHHLGTPADSPRHPRRLRHLELHGIHLRHRPRHRNLPHPRHRPRRPGSHRMGRKTRPSPTQILGWVSFRSTHSRFLHFGAG